MHAGRGDARHGSRLLPGVCTGGIRLSLYVSAASCLLIRVARACQAPMRHKRSTAVKAQAPAYAQSSRYHVSRLISNPQFLTQLIQGDISVALVGQNGPCNADPPLLALVSFHVLL